MATRQDIEDDMVRRAREPRFIDNVVHRINMMISRQAEGLEAVQIHALLCSDITDVLVGVRQLSPVYETGFQRATAQLTKKVEPVWKHLIEKTQEFCTIEEEVSVPGSEEKVPKHEFAKEYFNRVLLQIHYKLFNIVHNEVIGLWQHKYPKHWG